MLCHASHPLTLITGIQIVCYCFWNKKKNNKKWITSIHNTYRIIFKKKLYFSMNHELNASVKASRLRRGKKITLYTCLLYTITSQF